MHPLRQRFRLSAALEKAAERTAGGGEKGHRKWTVSVDWFRLSQPRLLDLL